MALDDILQAITLQADQRLSAARTAHERRLAEMRELSDKEIERRTAEIDGQKTEKLNRMRQKIETASVLQARNAQLETKQSLVDDTYRSVIAAVVALPDERLEALFTACLKSIPSTGEILPAKKHAALLKRLATDVRFTVGEPIDAAGGFRFVSDDREVDCTIEALVDNVLRPATELDTAASLFRS